MDILDIFLLFCLNHLSPLWGYFLYLPSASASSKSSSSTSARELKIIEKFLHPHHL